MSATTEAAPAVLPPPRRRLPRLRRVPLPLLAGLAILLTFLLCALAPDLAAPYDPLAFDYGALLQPPSPAHPFGTDQFGRDMLSRTVAASTIDLQIALFATLGPLVAGTAIGLFVGFYGGWADIVFGRLVAIVAVLGPGLGNMYIAISVVGWVFYARLMRAEVLVLRGQDFVSACRVLGYGDARILLRHVLPNAARPVLVYWMTDMALAILLGSSLGYLGLGAQPPTAEWGVLIADGKNFFTQAWWVSVLPGLAIVLCGFGFSLAGDGLADLLEVRR